MKESGLPKSDQQAIELFEKLQAMNEVSKEEGIATRAKLAFDPKTGQRTYDLGKADPTCSRCGGGGITGAMDVYTDDGKQRAPIICICVAKNGGLKKDMFDRNIDKLRRHLEKQAKRQKRAAKKKRRRKK